MSMTSFEVDTPQFEEGSFVRETRLLQPYDTQFDDWLAIRHDFMVRKGWRSPEITEWDEYDDNETTAHIALYGEDEALLFGMRLTPTESIQSSLSWRMVEASTIQQQIASDERSGALTSGKALWDLTRLVPGREVRGEASYEAIPRLFHEGLVYCQQRGDDDPTWVFALDAVTHRWLASQGVYVDLLGRDRVGSDRHETLFGVVHPAHIDQADGDFARRSRRGAA